MTKRRAKAAPWPATYAGRLEALTGRLEALRRALAPLQDAARTVATLSGQAPPSRWGAPDPDAIDRHWKLPGGASLAVHAGYHLETVVGEIGRGVVPPPDPLTCLASALATPAMWTEAITAFDEAVAWATEQAASWIVPEVHGQSDEEAPDENGPDESDPRLMLAIVVVTDTADEAATARSLASLGFERKDVWVRQCSPDDKPEMEAEMTRLRVARYLVSEFWGRRLPRL